MPKLLLCSMTVPWPDRPTQGLYHIEQARALRRRGVETSVFSPAPKLPKRVAKRSAWAARHAGRPEHYVIDEVDIHSPRTPFLFPNVLREKIVPKTPGMAEQFCVRGLRDSLSSMVERDRPDGLLVHGVLPWGRVAAEVAAKYSIPFSIIEHSAGDVLRLKPKSRLAKLYRKSSSQAKAVYVVGQPMFEHLQNVIGCPNVVLATNGVSLPDSNQDFAKRPTELGDGPLILAAGHYYRRKRFEELLESFARVVHQGFDATLVLVTAAPKSLRMLAEKLQLSSKVKFIPPCSHDELLRWMSWSDLFVLPSRREAFGLVYVESMACQTPVVMTEDCGMAYELPEPVPGQPSPAWVVPVNDERGLDITLQAAIINPSRLADMGRVANEYVRKHFSWDRNAAIIARHLFPAASIPK